MKRQRKSKNSVALLPSRIGDTRHGTSKLIKRLPKDQHLFIIFYDILYLNDKSLISTPLLERRQKLEYVVQPIQDFVDFSQYEVFNIPRDWNMETFDRLRTYFLKTLGDGEEGLMIKGTTCGYDPGRRRNWMKVFIYDSIR